MTESDKAIDNAKAMKPFIGKTIAKLSLDDEAIVLGFQDGTSLVLCDDGQSCCEARYMRTDDELQSAEGTQFLGADLGEYTSKGDSDEVQFLNLRTSSGVIQFCAHNEHNGYYGGFNLTAMKGEDAAKRYRGPFARDDK